jgi:hypothetical protein
VSASLGQPADGRGECRTVGGVGDVAGHDDGAGEGGGEVAGPARVGHDGPAAGKQGAGQRQAEAAPGAGDEGSWLCCAG